MCVLLENNFTYLICVIYAQIYGLYPYLLSAFTLHNSIVLFCIGKTDFKNYIEGQFNNCAPGLQGFAVCNSTQFKQITYTLGLKHIIQIIFQYLDSGLKPLVIVANNLKQFHDDFLIH